MARSSRARMQIARLENGPPVGFPIVIRISADKIGDLYAQAEQVIDYLYEVGGTLDEDYTTQSFRIRQ